jgi:NADH-quinone oxidoreductase E subunit
MELTPDNKTRFDEILKRYPVKRSALLPTLRLTQEQEGWLSREAIEHVAALLDLTPAQVHDTASFYTMFRLEPAGATTIEVCTTLSCALGGAEELLHHTCRKLGIEPGGTSADGKFTVREVECLAACGGAPAVQVNGEWLEHASSGDIDRILAGETVRRSFEWPRSPGEHVLFQNVWKPSSTSIEVYKESGGYAKLGDWLKTTPEDIIVILISRMREYRARIDRERAEEAEECPRCAMVARLPKAIADGIQMAYRNSAMDERARILAAVKALNSIHGEVWGAPWVSRAAVIAAIEGETT